MGKPAISLSYSIKYKGVISDGLNLPELVIEKNDSLWEKYELSTLVMSSMLSQ